MKKLILPILLFCNTLSVSAQDDPAFTMFWNNYNYLNPGSVGLTHQHLGNVSYNMPQNAFPYASIQAGYGARIKAVHGGIGVNYINTSYRHFSAMNKMNLTYSYHLQVGQGNLGIGLAAGVSTLKMDYSSFGGTISDLGTVRGSTFDLNAGLMYTVRNFMVGISSTSVNEPTYSRFGYKTPGNYYLVSSYNFQVGQQLELKPQALINFNKYGTLCNLNLTATYRQQFWLGASLGVGAGHFMPGVMAGVDIAKKFRIGYAYTTEKSRLSGVSGRHEVVLGIRIF